MTPPTKLVIPFFLSRLCYINPMKLTVPLSYKATRLINGKVELYQEQLTDSDLQENTVIVKLKYMGICRADVKEVTGSRDIPQDRGPLFGHEIIGEVVFAGSDTAFNEGSIVTFNPNITPDRTTGYAQYFKISGTKEILHNALIEVPTSIEIRKPWQPEPFACIIHSLKKLEELTQRGFFSNKKMAILGAGNSGAQFGLLGSFYGAEVTIFNRSESRLQFLANNLFDERSLANFNRFEEFANSFDIVVVVPTITNRESLEIAHTLAKPDGTILLYGGTRSNDCYLDSAVDIDQIRRQELVKKTIYKSKPIHIAGAYGCDRSDFEETFRLFAHHHDQFPIEKLVSKSISLDELPSIIMGMAEGTLDFPGKVIVLPN